MWCEFGWNLLEAQRHRRLRSGLQAVVSMAESDCVPMPGIKGLTNLHLPAEQLELHDTFSCTVQDELNGVSLCRRGSDAADDSGSDSDGSDGTPSQLSNDDARAAAHCEANGHSEPAQSQAPFDVMLTCYTLFERDGQDQRIDRTFLKSWPWSHLVLDEAHAVRSTRVAPVL